MFFFFPPTSPKIKGEVDCVYTVNLQLEQQVLLAIYYYLSILLLFEEK